MLRHAVPCHGMPWYAVTWHAIPYQTSTPHTHPNSNQRKQKKILNLSLHYTPCLVLSSKWTVPLDKTNEFQTKQINLEINLKMWSNLVGSLRSFMGFTYRRCKWRWMPNIHLHSHSYSLARKHTYKHANTHTQAHNHLLLLSFSILCHHHCQKHNITAPYRTAHTLLRHRKAPEEKNATTISHIEK